MITQNNSIKNILEDMKQGNYNEKEFKELTLWIEGIIEDINECKEVNK